MSPKAIQEQLERTLLMDGAMSDDLYEFDLADQVDFLMDSMKEDDEDFIITLSQSEGNVAMVLVEISGAVHINEQARERLKALWPLAYESNLKMMIPDFARQLSRNERPLYGVKVAK